MVGNTRIGGNDPAILDGLNDLREDQAAELAEEIAMEEAMASMYDLVGPVFDPINDRRRRDIEIGVLPEEEKEEGSCYDD